jgi:RNA polymerase sigma factor (sigma-70 family)
MEREIEYNLVRKIAWSYHKTTGVDYEDLYQQACFLYLDAMDRYKDHYQTKFTTFAWIHMRNQLADYVNGIYNSQDYLLEDSVPEEGDVDDLLSGEQPTPESALAFAESLDGLDPEAKAICNLVFSRPSEFAQLGRQQGRGVVKKTMRADGWTWNRIWHGFRQVKSLVNQPA